jgi:hypothetical protein
MCAKSGFPSLVFADALVDPAAENLDQQVP